MDTLKAIKPITDDSYLFEYLKFGRKTEEIDLGENQKLNQGFSVFNRVSRPVAD